MVPSCDLSQLADNLFALQKFHDQGPEQQKNVATGPSIDTFWNWFNNIVGLRSGLEDEKLADTLAKVKQEFMRCLDYQDSLETTLHLPRHIRGSNCLKDPELALLSIGTSCLFLTTHKMLLDPLAAVESLQKLYQAKTESPLLDDSYLQKLERFTKRYAMLTLAALLEVAYPTCCFSKVILNQKLESADIKVLSKWTKAIEKRKNHISVHLLHSALTAVVEGMLESLQVGDRSIAKNVAIVEWRLYFGLCDLLGEDDPVYLEWAKNTVYPGAHVALNEKQILVGNPFVLSLPNAIHARLYELPEDPSSLLFVGCNPAVLGIWQVNAERCAQGCPPVQVKDTDRYKRYFVIERVSMALADMQWKTSNSELDQTDILYIEPLVRFLAWLANNWEVTPRNLRTDYLFFQQQEGKVALRALMPFDLPGPHDFIAIEQFVQQCAKGNRWVFSHLMQASTLNQHPQPVLVRDIALKKLLGKYDDVAVSQMLSREGITDPTYQDQVEAMVQVLIERRDAIIFNLSVRLKSNTLQKELKECLASALVAHQQEMGFSSVVDPHLLESEGLQAFERAFIQANPTLF